MISDFRNVMQKAPMVGAFVGAVAFGLLADVTPAASQSAELLDRIDRLERDIRTLHVSISRGTPLPKAPASGAGQAGGPSGPAVARLGLRIDRLEDDIRVSTGSIEEINHRLNSIAERLDKLVSDVDYRLSALERGGGAPAQTGQLGTGAVGMAAATRQPPSLASQPQSLGTVSVSAVEAIRRSAPGVQGSVQGVQPVQPAPQPAAAPEPVQSAAVQTVLPPGTVKERYSHAFRLLRQANYDEAETALKEFIGTHGDDPLASNARYWLGETYYVRGAFQDAAQVFFEGFQKDPSGPKAPDTLLKLGMSLAELDKKPEACAAFEKVASDFHRASATVKSAVARERKRHACP